MSRNQRKRDDNVKTHPQIIDINLKCLETSVNFIKHELDAAKNKKKEKKVQIRRSETSSDNDDSDLQEQSNNDNAADIDKADKAKP
jgi:hypothetical protein